MFYMFCYIVQLNIKKIYWTVFNLTFNSPKSTPLIKIDKM